MPTTGVIYVGGREAVAVSRDGNAISGTALDSRNVMQAAIWQRRRNGGCSDRSCPTPRRAMSS